MASVFIRHLSNGSLNKGRSRGCRLARPRRYLHSFIGVVVGSLTSERTCTRSHLGCAVWHCVASCGIDASARLFFPCVWVVPSQGLRHAPVNLSTIGSAVPSDLRSRHLMVRGRRERVSEMEDARLIARSIRSALLRCFPQIGSGPSLRPSDRAAPGSSAVRLHRARRRCRCSCKWRIVGGRCCRCGC